jgi:Trk K+ transport system NAD-binding subunit
MRQQLVGVTMQKWQRRTVYYAILLATSMLVFALLYQAGMRIYEGDPRTFLHSLQVVVETFTTTGFGSDSPWLSAEMQVVVIVMDLYGTLLIFMAFPLLAFPLLEEVLSTTVPTAVPEETTDHVVICSYTSRADALIEELQAREVEYVIMEPARDVATELYENEHPVINADPTSIAGLEQAGLGDAQALVADVSDRVDTSIVLTAQEVTTDVPIISVVEEPDRQSYHRLAGADHVLSPRPLLGSSLASKVTTSVTTDLGDAIELGEEFEIAELPIHRGSRLVESTTAESGIRERSGVNVIGAWFQGEFQTPPDPDRTLTTGTVLLVTGRDDQLTELAELTTSTVRRFTPGETLVVGYGEVGREIAVALDEAGLEFTTVDRRELDGVDVVGDATAPETLLEAGLDGARSVILAMPDDTATEFTTLVIRDISPETEVIARVEETESVRKMYRAGADYVLSLATVSGRMIASTILEDEEVLSLDQQVEVVRTRAPALAGQTLGGAMVRSRTGCTVVSVERDGGLITDAGPDLQVEAGDRLIIAGTDAGVRRFTELMT